MQDDGFEYSDKEPEESDVDIVNQYYNSKGISIYFLCEFLVFFVHYSVRICMTSQKLGYFLAYACKCLG